MIGFIRSLAVARFFAVATVLMAIALNIPANAQTFRGTILGTVTDSSGAAVSGATVTVKNTGTGLVRTVTTDDDGNYSVPELPIGTYSVTVEKSGFKVGVVNGISVEVSTERRADIVLQPGDVSQTVEVSGDTLPQVESTSNTLGGIIESTVVTNLPVNGRDYQKLIFLVPGVAGSPDQITDSPGSYGIFSVNGARGRSNNFLLDGTDMNDGYRNDPAINEAGVFGTPATILPIEAIAELARALQFRIRIWPQRRRRHQHRHKERHQQFSWHRFRIFPQQRSRCPQLFQPGGCTAESLPQQSVWRRAGRPHSQRQNFFLYRL